MAVKQTLKGLLAFKEFKCRGVNIDGGDFLKSDQALSLFLKVYRTGLTEPIGCKYLTGNDNNKCGVAGVKEHYNIPFCRYVT